MPALRTKWAGSLAVVAVVLVAIGLITAGGRAAGTDVPLLTTGSCAAAGGPGGRTVSVTTEDGVRTARLRVPQAAVGHAAPLLLAFHGAGGSGRFMEHYSGLDREASRLGAITVYPDAKGRTWNLEDEGGPADVTFIRALLDKVAAEQCVDSSRIWAAGVSNGGGFTARLACVMADRLSAAVVVAGGFGALPECHPARPVSVLEIHGKGDRVVPYDGDARTSYRGAVLPWVRSWVKHDGCEARHSRHTRINRRTVRLDWGPCENGTMVSHFAIVRGAHQWPGATPPDPGPRPTISAANETWRFLTSLRHARRVVP